MAHSYSSLSKFIQCPYLYREQYILKSIKYTQSEAAAYGSEMHDFMDKAIKGTATFTPRYEFLKPVVKAIQAIPGKKEAEYELSFQQDWTPVGWWDKSSFIKGKLDLAIFHPNQPKMLVKDWKFAKVDPTKYNMELEMFSLLTFKKHPEIEEIKTGLVWLKDPAPETLQTFKKVDEPKLEDGIMSIIQRVEDAICFDKFPPKPNGLCQKFCDAVSCKHNGRNK